MRILILCTGNSCRSQIADGFLRAFDSRLEVHSAGSKPATQVNPYAIQVMDEEGIDLTSASPKNVSEFLPQPFDYVITVCGNAERECPAFTGQVRNRLHIGFPDPADATGSEDQILAVFRESRDSIRERFLQFYNNELKPQLGESS